MISKHNNDNTDVYDNEESYDAGETYQVNKPGIDSPNHLLEEKNNVVTMQGDVVGDDKGNMYFSRNSADSSLERFYENKQKKIENDINKAIIKKTKEFNRMKNSSNNSQNRGRSSTPKKQNQTSSNKGLGNNQIRASSATYNSKASTLASSKQSKYSNFLLSSKSNVISYDDYKKGQSSKGQQDLNSSQVSRSQNNASMNRITPDKSTKEKVLTTYNKEDSFRISDKALQDSPKLNENIRYNNRHDSIEYACIDTAKPNTNTNQSSHATNLLRILSPAKKSFSKTTKNETIGKTSLNTFRKTNNTSKEPTKLSSNVKEKEKESHVKINRNLKINDNYYNINALEKKIKEIQKNKDIANDYTIKPLISSIRNEDKKNYSAFLTTTNLFGRESHKSNSKSKSPKKEKLSVKVQNEEQQISDEDRNHETIQHNYNEEDYSNFKYEEDGFKRNSKIDVRFNLSQDNNFSKINPEGKLNLSNNYMPRSSSYINKSNLNDDSRRIAGFSKEFYDRNVKWKQDILYRSQLQKSEMEINEIRNCSFTPKVSESMLHRRSESFDEFYKKNMQWKMSIEKYKHDQSIIKERREFEECCFTPNLGRSQIMETGHKVSNDYFYKRGVNWIKQKNIRNKEIQLEYEERRIKEKDEKKALYKKKPKKEAKPIPTEKFKNEKEVEEMKKIMEKHIAYKSNLSSLNQLVDNLREALVDNIDRANHMENLDYHKISQEVDAYDNPSYDANQILKSYSNKSNEKSYVKKRPTNYSGLYNSNSFSTSINKKMIKSSDTTHRVKHQNQSSTSVEAEYREKYSKILEEVKLLDIALDLRKSDKDYLNVD